MIGLLIKRGTLDRKHTHTQGECYEDGSSVLGELLRENFRKDGHDKEEKLQNLTETDD